MDSYYPYIHWIDTQKDSMLQRLKEWVSINTYSRNTEGLATLLPLLHQAFRTLGGDVHYCPLTPQKNLTANGESTGCSLGTALVIRKRSKAPIQVLLGGHFDTVFSLDSPFQEITAPEDNIWKGPGVADMKGGIGILLTAVESFERSPWAHNLGWEILLTPDEEIGSPGSSSLYEAAALRNDIGLLFEPSFADGAFVGARKGSLTYTIVVRGLAAHVGRDFEKGRSAVSALARFILDVENFHAGKDLTVNISDLEAKGPVNIVSPLASCRINLRSFHSVVLQEASAYLQERAKILSVEREGITVDIFQESFRGPKTLDAEAQHLFNAYENCARSLNIPFIVRESGGVCDGNILAGMGLPTLDTAGVVGGGLHTHDEYIIVSSLLERAKLAALFLMKLAAGDISLSKEYDNG